MEKILVCRGIQVLQGNHGEFEWVALKCPVAPQPVVNKGAAANEEGASLSSGEKTG